MNFRSGERLLAADGSTPQVESFTPRPEPGPLYNIEAEGDRCFRVGDQGLLVHNMSQGTPTPAPTPACPPIVDSNEVQAVKNALNADITDFGVGVYHIPGSRAHLVPASQTGPNVGHSALVQQLNLNRTECRGFVIAKHPHTGHYVIENVSGLNVGSGGVGLGMPQPLFDSIRQAVLAAGL